MTNLAHSVQPYSGNSARNGSNPTGQRSDSRALAGVFVASFAVLLVVAVCGQLLGCSWRNWLPGAEGNRSLVGGVKSSVYTFMSYLS